REHRLAKLGEAGELPREIRQPGRDHQPGREDPLVARAAHAPPSATRWSVPRLGWSGSFSTRMTSSAAGVYARLENDRQENQPRRRMATRSTARTPGTRWIAASSSLRSRGVPKVKWSGSKKPTIGRTPRLPNRATITASSTSPRYDAGSTQILTTRSTSAYRGESTCTSRPA